MTLIVGLLGLALWHRTIFEHTNIKVIPTLLFSRWLITFTSLSPPLLLICSNMVSVFPDCQVQHGRDDTPPRFVPYCLLLEFGQLPL